MKSFRIILISAKKTLNTFLLSLLIATTLIFGSILNDRLSDNPTKVAKAAGEVLDSGFTANRGGGFYAINVGHVNFSALQTDGKIVSVGNFNQFNRVTSNRIARLNANGTVDTAFSSAVNNGFNANTRAVVIQTDGKIVVGGLFTSFNGSSINRIVRLNSNGTQDTTFRTNIGTGFNSDVEFLSLQPDGKIVVGGNFTTHNGASSNRIARLNSDGTRDATFTTNIGTGFNGPTRTLSIQSDGKIVVGGFFTSFNGTTTNNIARLNSDGTLDAAFTANNGSGSNNIINTIVLQTDGKIVVGGTFTYLNGATNPHIARINSNGTLDTVFTTNIGSGFNNAVESVAIQSDGKIVVGGDITFHNGIASNKITRLNSDGTRDTAFTTNIGSAFNGLVESIILQPDGQILVGGYFVSFNGTTTNNIARLNNNGTLDTAFTTNNEIGFRSIFASSVYTAVLQSDGKILVGGNFSNFYTSITGRIARLNSDGTTDTAFTTNTGSGFNSSVNTIVLQADGKMVVGGSFTLFNGTTTNRIARLNSNGTLDTTFTTTSGTGFSDTVETLLLQSDGKIVVGGSFISYNGTTTNRIAKLNSNGTLDTTFTTTSGTGLSGILNSLVLQGDGKIVAGGNFVSYNGTTTNRIARLNSDGTLDTAFTTNTGTGIDTNNLLALAIQGDGKIVVGGNFFAFNGTTNNRIARLNSDGTLDAAFTTAGGVGANSSLNHIIVQQNGKILIGGTFTSYNGTTANRFTRLNSNGSLDTAFNTKIGAGFDSTVSEFIVQSDGAIIIEGLFSAFDNISTGNLVRLDIDKLILSIKLFLSSSYDAVANLMNSNLSTLGIIPSSQPYNTSPFSYSGTETIGAGSGPFGANAANINIVDWVLIEIRDSGNNVVITKAGLLRKDGVILSSSTQLPNIKLDSTFTSGNYDVIIRHVNHLAISTDALVNLTPGSTTNIDYSDNTNVLNSNQSLIDTSPTNIYGLKMGNTNGDSSINATDRVLVRTGNESYNIYDNRDLNIDGLVDATDRAIVKNVSDVSDGIN